MAGKELEKSSTSTRKQTSPQKPTVMIDKLGVEQGLDTNLPFSTPFRPVQLGVAKNTDEELQELLREESEEWGPTVRQLITMRRMDGQARALYRLLTLPIRAGLAKATFVPAEDGEEEAEFIEKIFTLPPESGGMTVTTQRFMSQLLQGLFDGFSAFEKVFWKPEFGELKGKITLKKIAHRPAETISFIVDKQGGFAGLRQRAYMGGQTIDVFIPREYSFYYAAQEEERKFYGVSFFQSAFYHYDKKIKTYFTAHVHAQKAAVGTRVGTVPANATEAAKREFTNALNNLALAQWMAMPEGFKVESLKEAGTFDYLAWVNHHNSQMSKSILAGFFDKEQGAGAAEGSLVNFAQPGDDMFVLMLRSIQDDIADQINHYIIPQLIDFNFPGGKYPTFTWGKLTDEQKEAVAATFDKLASVQTVTPEFIRALEEHQAAEFGLEIDYDEVDQREEEMAAQRANIDPTTGLPFPGTDPATGQPLEAGDPNAIDPNLGQPAPLPGQIAQQQAEQGALPPAPAPGGAPAPEPAPAPAPGPEPAGAEPASATPGDQNFPGAELGLQQDFDMDDFEEQVTELFPPEDDEDDDEGEDELDSFDKNISLSGAPEGLIRMAQDMLEMAGDLNA